MPIKKRDLEFEARPGQLYKGITDISAPFEGETKPAVEQDHPFVQYCKKMRKRFPGMGKGAVFSDKQREAIDFLGWRLSAEDMMAAIKGTAMIMFIPAIIIIAFIYIYGIGIQIGDFDSNLILPNGGFFASMLGADMAFQSFLLLTAAILGAIGAIIYFLYTYPISTADSEKNRALTYVPEMIGYLIMSMKLVPNLEKAIEFSARHGRGKIALDFKRLIWDFQLGLFTSIAEGLDSLAYKWGDYSTELKESLMKIRACVMEPSESKRYQLLDKTMLEVLDSVKGKMEDYARGLNQPSVMLFYLGVLLPLLLIIILPVGSAFSGAPFATPILLVLIYCIAIPAIAFIFARNVVQRRPPTYEPPTIPEDFAGLPKKWHVKFKGGSIDARMIFAAIIIVGFFGAWFLSVEGFPPKMITPLNEEGLPMFQLIPPDKDLYALSLEAGQPKNYYAEKNFDLYFIDSYDFTKGTYYQLLLTQGIDEKVAGNMAFKEYLDFTNKNDPTKYIFWAVFIFALVCASCFLLYFRVIYRRKAQLEIIQMEDEFKESMYLIASRMGENKPVENALKQANEFLPNLMISRRVFGKTVENIELMGMPLESAVFDPIYGAMKGIPSKTLDTAMRLLVDSVSLGVEVASRTLMSLSLQMENMDKVNKSLKDLVSEVTATMQTMALFIAPIVLGITVALQKVVMGTLSGIVTDPSIGAAEEMGEIAGNTGGLNITSLFKVSIESFRSFAQPLDFLIIIAIYVIEIVIIMMYFTTRIQEDNDLLFKEKLAKSLPIAVLIFLVTAIVSNIMVSSLMTSG